nr:hypothetical protein Ade03nite_61750 [Actinoplanes derwentensis]
MASSLICALTVTIPGADMPAPPFTDGERGGLVATLSRIPAQRNPYGTRYPLVALLTVAVCAVLAGATCVRTHEVWERAVCGGRTRCAGRDAWDQGGGVARRPPVSRGSGEPRVSRLTTSSGGVSRW